MLRSEFCVAVMKNRFFVNEYETTAFKPVGESLLIFGGMDSNYQVQSKVMHLVFFRNEMLMMFKQ